MPQTPYTCTCTSNIYAHTHTSGHINIAVTLRGLRVLAKLSSAECVSVLAPDMAIRTKLMYIKDKSYAHKQIHSYTGVAAWRYVQCEPKIRAKKLRSTGVCWKP